MGRKAHFVRKSKWVLLFLSLFACVFASVGIVSTMSEETPTAVRADGGFTVTYTVETVGTVQAHGTYPSRSVPVYSSTYTDIYQLTKTNSMALMLYGYDGATISNVTLSMRSNGSSGSGYLNIKVGDTSAYSIGSSGSGVAFSNAKWNGAYTTSYVDISKDLSSNNVVGAGEAITITIGATANSLYCKSFSITYSGTASVDYIPTMNAYYAPWISGAYMKGKKGLELASDLHEIMWKTAKHSSTNKDYEYLTTKLQITDGDPSDSDYIFDFWTGEPMLAEWGGVWNREHVWPAANSNGAWARSGGSAGKSELYGGSDIHHIRPSFYSINTSRGAGAVGIVDTTKSYAPIVVNGVTSSSKSGKNSSDVSVFEPGDERKGDLARIFFYLYLTYSTNISVKGVTSSWSSAVVDDCTEADENYATYVADLTTIINGSALLNYTGSGYSSNMEMLLAWNELDPVDASESWRNYSGQLLQGNRNPFIDFPDLATFIFDPGDDGFYNMEMDANQTVLFGNSFAPTVRAVPASAAEDVVFTSSDSSVISTDGSSFSVVSTGVVRITGSVTIEGIAFESYTDVEIVSEITGITLSVASSYTLTAGKTFVPEAYPIPANAINRRITWSTSNSSIATIDSTTGKIKAVAAGNCTITATSAARPSVTASFALTVTSGASAGYVDIELSDFPDVAKSYDAYDWSSGGYSGVGYIYKASTISIRKSDGYLRNSSEFGSDISSIILYSSGTESTESFAFNIWTSDTEIDEKPVTEADGQITVGAYGASAVWNNTGGGTYFFLTPGQTGTAYLSRVRIVFGTPSKTLESISLDYSSVDRSYNEGEPLDLGNLAVTAVYDDGSSSDGNVFSLCTTSPADGAILSASNTQVVVTYTESGITMSASFSIMVAGEKTISSVSLSPDPCTIGVGDTVQLTMTVTYDDESMVVVTGGCAWVSGSTGIATVSSKGLVTGVATGNATITATFTFLETNYTDTCAITVTSTSLLELSVSSFVCTFDDVDFEVSFTATFNDVDVTAACVISSPLVQDGHYIYYRTLGIHEFAVSYSSGIYTYYQTITVSTTNVGAVDPMSRFQYALVDETSDLVAGDTYIIANSTTLGDSTSVLSTTQNDSNRSAIAYTKLNENSFQLLTLEAGTTSGGWAFNTGSGYLYASSSSSNQLKTKKAKDDNGSWAIGFSDGVTSIVAQGTNTRNVMQFNQNGSNPIFSCYGSASQTDVCLYRRVADGYTNADQASALKAYLDNYATCSILSNEAIVKSLALEYNALNNGTAKAAFAALSTSTASGDSESTSCYSKLYYIVQVWNTNHPNDQIFLYTTDYYDDIDDGGSGTSVKPLPAFSGGIPGIPSTESSPLTLTLWIVLGAGLAGMGAIGAAYWVSKKKKRFEA